ncbi:MAG: BTAD domain-containing putative transcriptional regulator, partial [Armatimonadota bacterium]
MPRDWLSGVLWPDSPEISALYNLRRCVYDIRRALGSEAKRLYTPNARTLSLDLAGADVDVLRFDNVCNAYKSGRQNSSVTDLEEAINIYGGPLLESCSEEWVFPERAAREQAYLNALEKLGEHAAAQRRERDAIGYFKQVISAEPLRESAYCSLMQILARGGDIAAVTQTYRDLRLLLHSKLNIEPSDKTQNFYKRIREQKEPHEQLIEPFRERRLNRTDICNPSLAEVEPVGGAVSMNSRLYIERSTDAFFY